MFQFTRPRGARRSTSPPCRGRTRFNSRAHGGRDMRMVIILRSLFVFQFTRPRGARRNPHHTTDRLAQFQFTRPRGARLETRKRILGHTEVSIHAPTGGATAASDKDGTRRICFNSRAHGGRDRRGRCVSPVHRAFQFTRPRGARRPCRTWHGWCARFNSRAHGGRDCEVAISAIR